MGGVLNGWIRRIHCYPIVYSNTVESDDDDDEYDEIEIIEDSTTKTKTISSDEEENNDDSSSLFINQIVSFMDSGTKCDDELSCFFQMPFSKLIDLIKFDGTKDICFIYRESDD